METGPQDEVVSTAFSTSGADADTSKPTWGCAPLSLSFDVMIEP